MIFKGSIGRDRFPIGKKANSPFNSPRQSHHSVSHLFWLFIVFSQEPFFSLLSQSQANSLMQDMIWHDYKSPHLEKLICFLLVAGLLLISTSGVHSSGEEPGDCCWRNETNTLSRVVSHHAISTCKDTRPHTGEQLWWGALTNVNTNCRKSKDFMENQLRRTCSLMMVSSEM